MLEAKSDGIYCAAAGPELSDDDPLGVDETAAEGTAETASRSDHIHPLAVDAPLDWNGMGGVCLNFSDGLTNDGGMLKVAVDGVTIGINGGGQIYVI